MRMLDLFSGIGGFSLAAQWVWGEDLEIVGFCENEPYPHKVLKKNFPGVPIHEDITKLDGKEFKNIDLITGGFPCQDISIAGRGAGVKEGTRSGLWFDLLRIIRDVRPRYALIENVPMLTIRGGTRVISDLTEIGYDAEWTIISAKDVGAWHRRKRIWICAYPEVKWTGESREPDKKKRIEGSHKTQSYRFCEDVPDTDRTRRRKRWRPKPIQEKFDTSERNSKRTFSTYWTVEPDVGRVANGIPSRVDRLRGLGNAIVPQVAALIMEKIKDAEI